MWCRNIFLFNRFAFSIFISYSNVVKCAVTYNEFFEEKRSDKKFPRFLDLKFLCLDLKKKQKKFRLAIPCLNKMFSALGLNKYELLKKFSALRILLKGI